MHRVQPIDHRQMSVATQIHAILVLAHAQEAEVLSLPASTPLTKTVEEIRASPEFFLGLHAGPQLLGVLSVAPDEDPRQLCICLLVVLPSHQRQGVGQALVAAALLRGQGATFCVVTGARKAPALALYHQLGSVTCQHGTLGTELLPVVKLRREPRSLLSASAHESAP